MSKTSNYQLTLWDWEDEGRLGEINENFAAIADALAGKAEFVTGTYTGNNADTRNINLGFRPKAVLLENMYGSRSGSTPPQGGLMLDGAPLCTGNHPYLEVTDQGFHINVTSMNTVNYTYRYIAFK